MSRFRIPSAPTGAAWVLGLALVAAPLTVSVAPRPAVASESDEQPDLELMRPVNKNPRVGNPGDDDQPTGSISTGSATRRGGVEVPQPPSTPVFSRLVEFVRAFVGRLGSMLR